MNLSIGVFTYSTKPRGSVVHAAALSEALTALGHDATLYALHKDDEGFYRPLRSKLVLVPARPAPAGADALIAQRIAEIAAFIRGERVSHDVFHAEDCLVGSGLIEACTGPRVPALVRTVHHVERFESPYLDRCQTRSILHADALVSVSEATRRDVRRTFGLESRVIENGVDLARFAVRDPRAELALLAKLGISGNGPLLLSVGGVEERKNTHTMLEAFLRVRESRPAATWVIAGGASILDHTAYASAFEERLAALTADQRRSIRKVGVLPEDELTSLFQTANVLVHAALHEGFGLSVLEALAARTPVVVSRRAPFDEYLDDGSATLVDPESPASIADGVLRALARPARTTLPGYACAARYSWTESALAHAELYRRTIDARRTLTSHPSTLHLPQPAESGAHGPLPQGA